MNSNRRTGVIVAAFALLLGFFLPWFDTPYIQVPSPFKMITGLAAYFLEGREKLLYPIPVCAVLLLFNEYNDAAPFRSIEKLLKILPLICWGLFVFTISKKFSSHVGAGTGELAMRGLMEVAQFGFYSTVIGVAWLFLLYFTPSKVPVRYTGGQYNEPYPAPQPLATRVAPAPQMPRGPSTSQQIGRGLGSLIGLVRHNWRISLGIAALLVSSYAGYAFFIKPNPEKEGKALAQQYCNCQQSNLAAQVRVKKLFLTKNASVAGVQEALRDSLEHLQEQYEICQQGAKEAVNRKLGDYMSSSDNADELQRSIEAHMALWTSTDSIKLRHINDQLASSGYNKFGPQFSDQRPVDNAGVKTFDLYGSMMQGIASGTATLELDGWLFDSRPHPDFASDVSGSIKFKIRVSTEGEVLDAVKISGMVSPAQEKHCKEALLGSTLTRAYSGSGGATGMVEFNFTVDHETVSTVSTTQETENNQPANSIPYQDASSETELKDTPEGESSGETQSKVYTYVEQMPELPGGGGNNAIASAIQERVKYPDLAVRNNVQGSILTSFTVGTNGEVSDVKIVKGLGSGLDEEVQRATKRLPRFTPGRHDSQAVNVTLTVPVTLLLK